ncbi:MAG: SIS domain-containing protein [Promethearchaeota archaeon]|jgi:6-phospho-3-hexuloisomerase
MSNQNQNLDSFYSAFELLVKTAKKTVNSINENPSQLVKFCNIIQNAKKHRIHLVGMGRSAKVGMLFGEMLKNIGYEVSYLGKSLAKPVRANDVVIGVTGSGWTSFTTKAIQNAILRKAKILVFTGDGKSLAARLADSIMIIPRGYVKTGSLGSSSTGKVSSGAPLTPLGTLFEMTAMAIGFGIVSGLREDSNVRGFNEGINRVLNAVDLTLNNIKAEENPLQQFINSLEPFSLNPEKNLFIFGSGLDSIVASISSIRLSHLGIHVRSTYDWRFRKEGDLLISISGSGVSSRTLERIKSAELSNMKILGLTSFPDSALANSSDILLVIEGRHEEVSADLRQISDMSFFVPSFEYAAAITLDSCVAQIASNLGITEESMRAEHANIE